MEDQVKTGSLNVGCLCISMPMRALVQTSSSDDGYEVV